MSVCLLPAGRSVITERSVDTISRIANLSCLTTPVDEVSRCGCPNPAPPHPHHAVAVALFGHLKRPSRLKPRTRDIHKRGPEPLHLSGAPDYHSQRPATHSLTSALRLTGKRSDNLIGTSGRNQLPLTPPGTTLINHTCATAGHIGNSYGDPNGPVATRPSRSAADHAWRARARNRAPIRSSTN